MADKKKNVKLTIDEYTKAREIQNKRRFKIEFYPWPVMAALGVPLATMIFLITVYLLHICNVAK
jgi:hypothetical protein